MIHSSVSFIVVFIVAFCICDVKQFVYLLFKRMHVYLSAANDGYGFFPTNMDVENVKISYIFLNIIIQVKKQLRDMEAKVKDQEEELDEQAGSIQMLEQVLMSLLWHNTF